MKETDPEALNRSQERVISAVNGAQWDQVGPSLAEALWKLSEVRPDFEELPSWIAAARASGALGEAPVAAVEQAHSILRSVVDRYGNESDRTRVAQMQSQVALGRVESPPSQLAILAADIAMQAARFRDGVRTLALAVQNDTLHVGRHTRVSFNRTLRIPEDGREYPLPAGFGRLPILRVEDYANRIPERWIEQGGFIIPLYQREALFLEFAGVQWRPTIGKVSVGRVNAVSGKEHDLKIRPHRQDYIVIPDQRWLDGINSGSGSVSQFVAMPLGKGYTIEAQITDEEKHGGFQLAIFDPRTGRFPDQDPTEREAAMSSRKRRSLRAAQEEVLSRLPTALATAVRAVQKQHYKDAARVLGLSEDELLEEIEDARTEFENVLGPDGFDDLIPEDHLKALRDRGVRFMPDPCPYVEMGIAKGGKIRQQIIEDTYGVESWDEAAFRDFAIHIVNSEVYQQITGRPAPPTPITAELYQKFRIPWYSDYKEKAPSLSPVAAFKRVFSIGQIDKNRGVAEDEAPPTREIQPEEILRIHTPTIEERWKALLDRAVESSNSGHHRIAAREASLALDLADKHPLPFFIRALSNHSLGHYSDAEADASACLQLQPDNVGALRIRALSSLELGDALLAKNDAELLLAAQPDDPDGLSVRAEANLQLEHYNDALSDAEAILRDDPANRLALRIRRTARTEIHEETRVSQSLSPDYAASASLKEREICFETLQQQLIEIGRPLFTNQAPKWQSLWNDVREVAEEALIDQSQRVFFMRHYVALLREASMLDIPLERARSSDWLALVFESAFAFASVDHERASKLIGQVAPKREYAHQIVETFKDAVLHWPAHDFVRQVVDNLESNTFSGSAASIAEFQRLRESSEIMFWTGIRAATDARQDPGALELIEFLDVSCARRWGDFRLHINRVRTAPQRSDGPTKEGFEHPLLGIAAEKYRNNSMEAEIIGPFLVELCLKPELQNERDHLDRDTFLCQWVQKGICFGEKLLKEEPHKFVKMLQTANGDAGDSLLAFYRRVLSRVDDRTDPLSITRAFLEWQAEQRDEADLHYYGERLETLLNCIDAAIYLPWAEATRNIPSET